MQPMPCCEETNPSLPSLRTGSCLRGGMMKKTGTRSDTICRQNLRLLLDVLWAEDYHRYALARVFIRPSAGHPGPAVHSVMLRLLTPSSRSDVNAWASKPGPFARPHFSKPAQAMPACGPRYHGACQISFLSDPSARSRIRPTRRSVIWTGRSFRACLPSRACNGETIRVSHTGVLAVPDMGTPLIALLEENGQHKLLEHLDSLCQQQQNELEANLKVRESNQPVWTTPSVA